MKNIILTSLPWAALAGVIIFNAYMVYDFIKRYRINAFNESGIAMTWEQRILMSARGSMTIVVLKVGTMFWSIVLSLAEFGDLVAMPEVKEWLNSMLGVRGSAAVSLVFILITYVARIRKFSSEPVLK